jgi:hypothetical protein
MAALMEDAEHGPFRAWSPVRTPGNPGRQTGLEL